MLPSGKTAHKCRPPGALSKRPVRPAVDVPLSDPEIVTHSSPKTALCLFNPSAKAVKTIAFRSVAITSRMRSSTARCLALWRASRTLVRRARKFEFVYLCICWNGRSTSNSRRFSAPQRTSASGLGCVKTCARDEVAELFSLLSSPDGVHQRCCFSN
jgi:hypothetical protein